MADRLFSDKVGNELFHFSPFIKQIIVIFVVRMKK